MNTDGHGGPRIDADAARRPTVLAIVVRALLYALAIAVLVIYAPEQVEFVYMGF